MFIHKCVSTPGKEGPAQAVWWNHLVGTGLESDLLFRVFFGGLGGWSPCLAPLWISRRFSRWNLLSHWSHLNRACAKRDSTFTWLLKVFDEIVIKSLTEGILLFSWNCELSSFNPDVASFSPDVASFSPDEGSSVSHIADSALMVFFCCSTFICFSSLLIWPFSTLIVCFGCRCSALSSFGPFPVSLHS